MAAPRTTALLFRLAVRNVRRGWRHSLAAIGTMAIGFVALATFQGYLEELIASQIEMSYARNMIGDVLVRKPGAGSAQALIRPDHFRLGSSEQAFLERWLGEHRSEIKTRMRLLVVPGVATAGSASAAFLAIGHDIPEGRIARRNWAFNAWAGRPVRDDEPNAMLIGLGLGQSLGCRPTSNQPVFDPRTALPMAIERPMRCTSSTIQMTASSPKGRVNALDAEVVGLSSGGVREFDNQMAWLPLKFAQDLAETHDVDSFQILLHDPSQAEAIRTLLRADAAKAGLELEVADWRDTEQAELFRRGTELLATYRSLVVMVLLVIAGSAVLTTMAKTVRERTREIGTLRSLGFRRRHMLAMFVLEAAVLALLSGVLGALAATTLRLGINHAGITYRAGLLAEDLVLTIGWSVKTYGAGFLFLTAVAVLAAWLAARRVVAMRVAEALAE